ncbi:MAG: hypothetical protein KBS86_00560 [Proteobacteria bacterium]|nr:hypothetical protein [Candidatus Enterousia scatequi]
MLKADFEKKHKCKLPHDAAVGVDNYDVAKQYGLLSLDQPAHIWHIVKNIPDDHFTHIDVKPVREIFKYLAMEKRKPVRDYYLSVLFERYFFCGWGWFSRAGSSMSAMHRDVFDIPDSERREALKVLRALKYGFKKYHYKKYTVIDNYIVRYGGNTQPKKEQFNRANKNICVKNNKRLKSRFSRLLHTR